MRIRSLFRRMSYTMLAFVLIVTSFGATTQVASAATPVGGFENPDQWSQIQGDAGEPGSFDIVTDEAHSGSQSARIQVDRLTGVHTWTGISTPVKQLQSSHVQLYVKTSDFARVSVRMIDSTGQTFQRAYDLAEGGDWQMVDAVSPVEGGAWGVFYDGANDGVWHAPMGNIQIIFEELRDESATVGVAWVDDVAVVLDETNTGDGSLAVTGLTTLFQQQEAVVELAGSDGPGTWQLNDPQGLPVASGDFAISNGVGGVDLNTVDPGYYSLILNQGESVLTVPVGILSPLPARAFGPDSPYGVGTHFSNSTDIALMPLIKLLGYSHIRDEAFWDWVEKVPGEYNFSSFDAYIDAADEMGLGTMLIADYGNPLYDAGRVPDTVEGHKAFAAYAAAAVEHFGDKIEALEVFNEFNWIVKTSQCGLSAQCYLPLLKETRAAVKAVNPDIPVIGPTPAGGWGASYGFNEAAINDTDMLDYLDAYTYHPYLHPGSPETNFGIVSRVVDAIRAKGSDMPVYADEVGWPTHTGASTEDQQADFLIRNNALAFEAGVARTYWYVFLNTGTDPDEAEDNFGLFNMAEGQIQAVTPKPAAVAAGVEIRMLGGLGEPTRDTSPANSYVMRYGTGGDAVRLAWATTPTDVSIPAEGTVRVTDRFGATRDLAPVNGQIRLQLDGHPVYLTGNVTGDIVAASSDGAFSATTTPTVGQGQEGTVTVSVDGASPEAANIGSKVTFSVGGESVEVAVVPGEVTSGTLTLPPSQKLGDREIVVVVSGEAGTLALLTLQNRVVSALQWKVVPVVEGLDPFAGRIELRLVNETSEDVVVTKAALKAVEDQSLTEPVTATANSTTVVLTQTVADAKPWVGIPYEASASTQAGDEWKARGDAGLAVALPVGKFSLPPVTILEEFRHLAPDGSEISEQDAANSSGDMTFEYDEEYLWVNLNVTDDVHSPNAEAANMWNGDSVQIATSPMVPGLTDERAEYVFGLTPTGAKAFRYAGGTPGDVDSVDLDITREGTVTKYRIGMKWADLQLEGEPTEPFGISVLVNEVDVPGERTWWEWGSGIGVEKDLLKFRAIQTYTSDDAVEPSPSPSPTVSESPSPSPSASESPSASPSPSVSPTSSPTATGSPTVAPSSGATAKPTTTTSSKAPVRPTGNSTVKPGLPSTGAAGLLSQGV